MSEEAGRHFIGPVPVERECAGRNFQIISKGSDSGTLFRCTLTKRVEECFRGKPTRSSLHAGAILEPTKAALFSGFCWCLSAARRTLKFQQVLFAPQTSTVTP
jgi:hypothetical protein